MITTNEEKIYVIKGMEVEGRDKSEVEDNKKKTKRVERKERLV